MFKKALLGAAILFISTAAIAADAVTVSFKIPAGFSITFDEKQLGTYDSIVSLSGTHKVGVRSTQEASFSYYSISFDDGSFLLGYQSGSKQYPVSVTVNRDCTINNSTSSRPIQASANDGDSIAIYFNQTLNPAGTC